MRLRYRRRFLLLTIGRGTLHVGRARLRYGTVRHQLAGRWVALGWESLRHVHILRDSWIIDDGGRERIDHRRVVMRPTVTHLLRVVAAQSQNLSVAYLSYNHIPLYTGTSLPTKHAWLKCTQTDIPFADPPIFNNSE